MPQPVAFNTGSSISGSIQASKISYAIETSGSNYRSGYAGKSWYSELPATTGIVFIKDTTSIGRGAPGNPAFWITNGTSSASILATVNGLPGSPRNFTTTSSAYSWSLANGFFINDPNEPFNQIDTDGLALYLDASKTVSYPTTASTWYDISGNNNKGTLTNGPTFNSLGVISFDNVDDYVQISSSLNLNTLAATKNMTICYTAKKLYYGTGGNNNGISTILAGVNNGYGSGFRISETSQGTPGAPFTGTPQYEFGAPDLQVNVGIVSPRTGQNTFSYVCFSQTGSSILGFINGKFTEFIRTGSYITGSSDGRIGVSAAGQGYFGGYIGNFQIYNRALTQTEILQNYYQAPIVTDGLVLALDAGNLVSYESGSTTTYSMTGSLTGSLVNGVKYNSGNGGSWVFDGTDDYINFGNTPSTTITGSSVSLEAWVNYNISQQDWKGIMYKANGNSSGYQLFIDSAERVAFGVITTAGFSRPNAGFTLPENTWNHIVGSYDGSNMRIYVNGILYSTTPQSGSILTSTTNLYVGMSFASEEFPGYISVARIYNRGLSTSEVQQNFNAQRNRFNI
jgi:hypothetical protein